MTGSSGGIGRGIAPRPADDGFDIVVNDIALKQADIDAVVAEIAAKGKNAIGIAADVSNKEHVQVLFSGSVEKFGALNVMVANAGILETTPLLELSVEQWDRSMAINLRGGVFVYPNFRTSIYQARQRWENYCGLLNSWISAEWKGASLLFEQMGCSWSYSNGGVGAWCSWDHGQFVLPWICQDWDVICLR